MTHRPNVPVLRILHQNVQYLSNKVEEVEVLLSESDPQVIVLTEHGLFSQQIELFHLKNYKIAANFCRETFKGGGVVIYVKNDLNFKNLKHTKEFCNEKIIEMAAIKLHTNIIQYDSIYVVGIYRSPSAPMENFLNTLDKIFNNLLTDNTNLILMGDLNINSGSENSDYNNLCDVLRSYNLHDVKLPPTRVTATTSSTIDHIITNLNIQDYIAVVNNYHISDHFAQYIDVFNCKLSIEKPLFIEIRHLTNYKMQALAQVLSMEDWTNVYKTEHVNEKWLAFIKTLNAHLNAVCPITSQNIKQHTKSKLKLPYEILTLRNLMKDMYDFYKHTKLEIYKSSYKSIKRQYRQALVNFKAQEYTEQITQSTNISNTVWKMVRNTKKAGNREQDNMCLEYDGEYVSNPIDISLIFNSHFLNAGRNIENETTLQNNHSSVDGVLESIFIKETSVEEIEKIITNLKNQTSSGWDGISTKILKMCKDPLLEILKYLINVSISRINFSRMSKTQHS